MNPSVPFYIKPKISKESIVFIDRKSKAKIICPHCKKERFVRIDGYKNNTMGLCMPCSKKIITRHGFFNHPIYHAWEHIKTRCYNKKFKQFNDYGGRGISICEEWKNCPEAFIQWSLLNGHKDGLTIDRIDNNGNYEPSNCRWVDRFIQMENTRELNSLNTSGFRGISFNKRSNSWRCYYNFKNKRIFDKSGFCSAKTAKIYRENQIIKIKSATM